MIFDVIVIGGGIIGNAAARELAKYKGTFGLIEGAPDIASGTTKGTGGLIHAGYDPPPGTLKARLNVRGNRMYESLARELSFPYRKTGSLVVGFDGEDRSYLQMLYERGLQNGVEGLELVEGARIWELEPAVSPKAVCALYAAHTAITDPYETAIALAENAVQNGVTYFRSSPVTALSREDTGLFRIEAGGRTLLARAVINAAGTGADEIARLAGDPSVRLVYKHGDLLIFDKQCGLDLHIPLYPVPSAHSKGIAVVPTVSGNISVGSTSVLRQKGDLDTYAEGVRDLIEQAPRLTPALDMKKIIRAFAGLRAVADNGKNDFDIRPSETAPGLYHAAGIQSPGVSSAPAIAAYLADLLQRDGRLTGKNEHFQPCRQKPVDVSELDEQALDRLILQNPDYGEVICRCELVTKGEILDAIRRPLGAVTVDGVKRRTRAGMGRCQGGFCQHRVLELLAQELDIPPEKVLKEKLCSEIVLGKLKG